MTLQIQGCPRCRGALAKDRDGDYGCIACGFYSYSTPPAEYIDGRKFGRIRTTRRV